MAELFTATVLAFMGGALIVLAAVCGLMLSMQRRILRNQIDMLDFLDIMLNRPDNVSDLRAGIARRRRRWGGPPDRKEQG